LCQHRAAESEKKKECECGSQMWVIERAHSIRFGHVR
jgi:hypothetical protein